MSKFDQLRQLADVMNEQKLLNTILLYGRAGHATELMIEQAIEMCDRHVAVSRSVGDEGLAKLAGELKRSLEQVLIAGPKSLQQKRAPGPEVALVEEPLVRMLRALGHRIERQKRCSTGQIDIFDISANEIIECKADGSNASLGQAAGQLKRYARSFPGVSLAIAVRQVQPDAMWLAQVLREQGIRIIELG